MVALEENTNRIPVTWFFYCGPYGQMLKADICFFYVKVDDDANSQLFLGEWIVRFVIPLYTMKDKQYRFSSIYFITMYTPHNVKR